MTSRSFQEQILSHLDPDNADKLSRLDSKSLEQEFQSVIQLLTDAPELRIDDEGVWEEESLVEKISDRVTSKVLNLFAPVLAKMESRLDKLDKGEVGEPFPRFDSAIPIKRLVKHQGFTLGITHEQNSIRFPYSLPLSAGYGHIRRSYGAAEDKKAIDVYWGGDDTASDIYRVRQLDPDTGFAVEQDYFMGFGGDAPKTIKELYFRHLGHKRFGGIEKVNLEDLASYRDAPAEEHTDAIPEGYHWVNNEKVKGGGYVRKNWWEERKQDARSDVADEMDWDNLRYDSPDKDDWDDSDYLIDYTMSRSGKVFNRWLSTARNWVSEQGSLEAARDRIGELYQQLDGKKFAQFLEQGMTLADLGGRLSVVTESGDEDEEAADRGAERESQDGNEGVEGGGTPYREVR